MNFLTLLAGLALVQSSTAVYVLQDNWSGSNFFNQFDFFTAADPTHGFVRYVDQGTAQNTGLIKVNGDGSVYMGVDHTNVTPNGRPSVRVTSKKAFNAGSLIILDLTHMPGAECGIWPAFWTVVRKQIQVFQAADRLSLLICWCRDRTGPTREKLTSLRASTSTPLTR